MEIQNYLTRYNFFPQIYDCGDVEIFDSNGQRAGFPMLRMEYLPGVNLSDYLEQHQNNSLTLQNITTMLGKRLKELHRATFCHGDPHLENVLVSSKANELNAAVEHPYASLHLITLTPETAHGTPGQVSVHPAAQWFLAAVS
jgi:serine/threonine protein kinase